MIVCFSLIVLIVTNKSSQEASGDQNLFLGVTIAVVSTYMFSQFMTFQRMMFGQHVAIIVFWYSLALISSAFTLMMLEDPYTFGDFPAHVIFTSIFFCSCAAFGQLCQTRAS